MPAIYTEAWYSEIQEMLNRNPDVEKNAPRGRFRVLIEVQGDAASAYVDEGQNLWFAAQLDDGKCVEYAEIFEAPPRKDFDFTFEFPASVFEGVAAGKVDPIQAGLKGTIKISGDMRVLIKHADLVNTLHDIYAREVETSWPKGEPTA
jgi:putative sterol carrier protein